MAKKRPRPHHEPLVGDITLAKPDFEQALAFAEVAVKVEKPIEITAPIIEVAEKVAPAPVLDAAKSTTHENVQVLPSPKTAEIQVKVAEKKSVKRCKSAADLMPKDPAMCKVLAERATAIAIPVSQQQYEQRNQYLRFRLGAVEQYGIPYTYLEELRYVGNLSLVPCAPAFVAGVVNHRGELLTVLDLKQFFRMSALEQSASSRIVVAKYAGTRIGLLVDDVDGNEEYQSNELAPAMGSDGVTNMEYVLGIHAGRVTLLNLAALLNDPALRVMH